MSRSRISSRRAKRSGQLAVGERVVDEQLACDLLVRGRPG
jgi:hypothetical protein